MRSALIAMLAAGTMAGSAAQAPQPVGGPIATVPVPPGDGPSRALGRPNRGLLLNGVQLPSEGEWYRTWDPILKRSPNRGWRRWGTTRLLSVLEQVAAERALDDPAAPPLLIGDLSRPHGGAFGKRYGGLGHASHQNGLDADVYYPRRDGLPLAAYKPSQVDRRAAQDLVDRFVAAGAQYVFVGTALGLRGPRRVVQVLAHHNDHLHVRLRPGAGA
ncbi:MAG: penicillin-insensitive murein endopeptidase [Solirubrobacterales bacterium]|nr:penicillin-insensitive murein endopeptidase [Solirubrobacterales bacterium]